MAWPAYAPGGLQKLPEKLTLQTPLQQPETPRAAQYCQSGQLVTEQPPCPRALLPACVVAA
jgi:hypothetical protein